MIMFINEILVKSLQFPLPDIISNLMTGMAPCDLLVESTDFVIVVI